MTLPVGSVIEMIVLLNVLLMWACPWATFFRSLRRTFLAAAWLRLLSGISFFALPHEVIILRCEARAGPGDTADYFFPAFFLPATVFFLPLRVRALVCVRWP